MRKWSPLLLVVALMLTACNAANTAEENQSASEARETQNESVPQSQEIIQTPWIATKNTTRIATKDPFQAAVLVSKTLWPATSETNRPGGVILTRPDDWQSALVSTDLIHFPNNGPVLFVEENQIPEVTVNELKRLNPLGAKANQGIQVIITGKVDPSVEEQVQALGFKTDRLEGADPAPFAKAVDDYYANLQGSYPKSVIIGSMDSPEYTLPAGNWISHMPEPLLYVTADSVPKETAEALQKRNGSANIYILGPESVILASVEQDLSAFGKVTRISGKDPYENAVAFAKFKDPKTQFGWGITTPGHNLSFIPTGSNELALAAAPFSHLGKHAPMLWANSDKVPESVKSYIQSIQPKYKSSPAEGPYNHAWITGDESLIGYDVQAVIDEWLEIVSQSGEDHGNMTEDGGMSDMPGMQH